MSQLDFDASANKFALHKAAKDNHLTRIVELLSSGQVNVDAIHDYNYTTPLHWAANFNNCDSHFDTIEVLLKNEASVNAQDNDGRTPLDYSVKNSNFRSVQLLLNFKADVNIKNRHGETPLFEAVRGENMKIVQLLIGHGSHVDNIFDNGSTPLHIASQYNNKNIIKILLANGADISAQNFEGRTPVFEYMLYCHTQSTDTLMFLLKYSDVNFTFDSYGRCILDFSTVKEITWKTFLSHIAKLQALNIPVDPSFMEPISKNHKYNEYFKKCKQELEAAIITNIDSFWVTFFNLLVDSKRKLKNYAGNQVLISAVNKSDYLNKFPIYGPQVQEKVRKGLIRRELYDQSTKLLSDNIPILDPYHLIIRDTLDLVSTKDLDKFCEPIK